MHVYLDESGDTGWTFTSPYGNGGSSRYLTIGYLIVPEDKRHLPKRLVKKIYEKFHFRPGTEIKATALTIPQKEFICSKVIEMLERNEDFKIGAITVKKELVGSHIRKESNTLYNYLIGKSVLGNISKLPKVMLYRDERTVSVASGNSCIDYLRTTLWFEHESETDLIDRPTASHTNLNVMLVDWITNIVWSHYERNIDAPFLVLSPGLLNQTLFF